ncbi:MAG: PDZ domain-containing protein [Acidimicrobiia bacterium]|nr:PDZ domain-containing protein [Acidimicrobiia bacterium]
MNEERPTLDKLSKDYWPAGPIPRPADAISEPTPSEKAARSVRRMDLVMVGLLALIVGAGGTAAGLLGTDLLEGRITDRAEEIVDAALDDFEPPVEVVTLAPPADDSDSDPLVLPLNDDQLDSELGQIVAEALPSVVRVVVSIDTGTVGPDGQPAYEPVGTGSGIGFTDQGHLLTNNHVIDDADLIQIELVDGRIYEAELIGADELTDVGVIKVAPGLIPPIELGISDDVAIGDTAIAVGNPLGLAGGPSVTVGIISAFGRQLDILTRSAPLQGLIQTDAPISGGSSGGALLDADGRLIGITTAKSVGESAEGLGFAIPIDLATGIAIDLISFGVIDHPFLGILGTTAYVELDDGASQPAGARIVDILGDTAEDVVDASAFGDAGAAINDVIVAVDGERVQTMNQLATLMRFYRAGDVVTVTVVRDGEQVDLEVELASRPEGT